MLKKLVSFFLFFSLSTVLAQSIEIAQSGGLFESAFIEWNPVANADSYHVYFSGEGIVNQKIDDQLIRYYGSYYRADILGLKAGNYSLSIAAVISGNESHLTTINNITVVAHDRTGFAFSNGRVPGAYQIDGTPKPDAVVLYVTEHSKNTISLNVVGANANPCVGLQSILDGFKKGNDNRPLIIRLIGQITDFDYMLSGDLVIENNNNAASHITLEGVGKDAVAYGWGIRVKNASNIEIRNLGTMLTNSNEGDNVGLQQSNEYIWVHHMDFFYGDTGGASDQAKGDGALDCKKSTYVTFSYNHFWDTGKSNLLGLSENTISGLYITYHHNWFDHSDSRHPRVRFYSAHVYNNYYDGISKYGVGSTNGSSIFVEGNYFRHCKYPMLTSMQGSDIFYGGGGTFSSEDGGTIKAFNNTIIDETRFIAYNASNYPVEFDAYVATSRDEMVSASITSKQGSNRYNNFDTDETLYIKNLVVETPEVAKENVVSYAGRYQGGDFSWTFNDAVDDTSYNVNIQLKNALINYATSLVAVQGDLVSDPKIELTAQAGDSQVHLSWIANNFAPTAYEIFRNNQADPSGRISIKNINNSETTQFIDTTVVNDNTYYYWVVADETIESNVDAATPSATAVGSGDEIHNFTVSGTNSSFYNISGNLSTTKGTVQYNGLTLTQCLKIESSTNISFITSASSTLTLVFNEVFSGNIKIDGINYPVTNGILSHTLPSGSHSITKADVANLYYMSITYESLVLTDINPNSVRLYPNPVSNILYLNPNDQIRQINIYTTSGKLVKTLRNHVAYIDLSNIIPGQYLIQFCSANGVNEKMFIKN